MDSQVNRAQLVGKVYIKLGSGSPWLQKDARIVVRVER